MTLEPLAPSAGSAAASHICLGRLLPALYLKLGTFFPSPFSMISPLPPLPDLQQLCTMRDKAGCVCYLEQQNERTTPHWLLMPNGLCG